MYITSISPSSYNTSLDCPMKYYIGNVLRIREDTNMAAYKGTMVHFFFEVLASIKKAFDAKEKTVTIKGFREVEVVDPYSLNVDELFEEIYNKFVQDNNLEFDEEDKKECRKHIDAVLGTDEDVRGLKIISTEHKFSVDLEYEWAYFLDLEGNPSYLKINGVIDLVTELDEKTLKFIDYKTGQRKDWIKGTRKEYADMADDIQLHMYDMVLRKLYPQYENFHVCIIWTKDGGAYDFVFSPQSAEKTLSKIRERYESIRDSLVPRLNRTWKCKKFCTYGQESLPDAPVEYRRNQLNDIGQPMCMCSHLHAAIKKEGIVAVTEKYKKKKEVINDESVDMGTGEQSGT